MGKLGANGGFMSSIALRAACCVLRAAGKIAGAGQRPVSLSVQYVGGASFAAADVVVRGSGPKTGALSLWVGASC